MDRVLSLSAVRQARMVRERQISSRELVAAHIERIERLNSRLGAAVEILSATALQAADAADKAVRQGCILGPLHGIPFSIKDSIEVEGTVCSAGTLGRANAKPSREDAVLVARLRAAGAIPIARTNLPDLLFAFESDNLLFGRTNNPYDVTRSSGGSSGGEAALIGACGSPLGLGSDAAGSVRLPAAFCGIAGIKPTSGRLPRTGHFPPAGGWIERLWQIGPMARWVEDLVAVMPLLVGPDGRDWTASPMPLPDPALVAVENLRVAFYTDNGTSGAVPEVAQVVRAAAASFGSAAASVEEDRPAVLEQAYDLEMKLIGPDGGDGLRAYLAALGSTRHHPLLEAWLQKLEHYRTDLAGFTGYIAEWDSYRSEMYASLNRHDILLCPAYTEPALPHGASVEGSRFRGFSHTMAFNLAGWPAAVVRCGTSSSGLPVAVQVAAAPWREDIVLAAAAWLEREMGGWAPPPGELV